MLKQNRIIERKPSSIFSGVIVSSVALVGFAAARLLMATDTWKDQTLFLCQIKQDALQRHMFPIGDLMKENVKKIAREAGLERIAQRKEVYLHQL